MKINFVTIYNHINDIINIFNFIIYNLFNYVLFKYIYKNNIYLD